MRILSKHIFSIGLFFVLLSGLVAFFNHTGFALRVIILSFWIIVGGALLYIFELKNEK